MKILDLIFYIILSVSACVAMFLYNMHADLYFPSNSPIIESGFEIYEKDSIDVPLANADNIALTRLSNDKYLLTFLNKKNLESNLPNALNNDISSIYGILFLPNKYSLQDSSGNWQNVAINVKSWGDLRPLTTTHTLFDSNRQIVNDFSNPILQQNGEKLFLFVNGQNFAKINTAKIYVFTSEISEIIKYFSTQNTESSIDSKAQITQSTLPYFRFYKKITLGALFNLNYYLSSKALAIDMGTDGSNFILPIFAKFAHYTSIFAVFNSKFNLKAMIRPNKEDSLYKPLIASMQSDIDKANAAHRACIAVYQSSDIMESKSRLESGVAFQTCETINGILNFNEIKKSQNIVDANELSIATLGAYTFLVYNDLQGKSMKLALFNGEDFIEVMQLDSTETKSFFNPSITINGLYAYITYADRPHNKIHIITLNENYLKSLASQNNIQFIFKSL